MLDITKEEIANLAKEVLILSRNMILVHMRFMDMALSKLKCVPIDKDTILTNGEYIFYNPLYVLKCYKKEKEILIRNYLHMVMHCVFRHMYVSLQLNSIYWDIACDIAVENIITELKLKMLSNIRECQQAQYIARIKNDIKQMTAEKIYLYLKQTIHDSQQLVELGNLFYVDDHAIWYMEDEEISQELGLVTTRNDIKQVYSDLEVRVVVEEEWKRISERMQTELLIFGKKNGDVPGSMIQNLISVNREKYNYTAFLRKFAVMRDVLKSSEEEFDYIFYNYGLQIYKNMPLIEPLEYKEVRAIKEFVIVIDTSGSTSGNLVQKFLQKTYNVLKSTESFFEKINLHIIQCDAKVQEDIKITSQKELDIYFRAMQIRGMGGTDFRPAFEYVDQLYLNKEFINLNVLIYFTDGFGVFPKRKPRYKTAFVFVEDKYNNYVVPFWAIKLILPINEI